MKPIGLRFGNDGELMVVHRCLSCGSIPQNRIAGDDIPETILSLIHEKSDPPIDGLLSCGDIHEIYEALYGKL